MTARGKTSADRSTRKQAVETVPASTNELARCEDQTSSREVTHTHKRKMSGLLVIISSRRALSTQDPSFLDAVDADEPMAGPKGRVERVVGNFTQGLHRIDMCVSRCAGSRDRIVACLLEPACLCIRRPAGARSVRCGTEVAVDRVVLVSTITRSALWCGAPRVADSCVVR